jgi:hypothetical protein
MCPAEIPCRSNTVLVGEGDIEQTIVMRLDIYTAPAETLALHH